MKKKIIAVALICSFTVGCIGLSGCTTNNVSSSATSGISESSFVSEYASKYDFYADSIEILKDDMELTNEEADKVFGVLLEVGLDEEVTYCFDEKDDSGNQYFKVWWGLEYVNVYLRNNIVDKILDRDVVIYENGKIIETTKEPTTEEPTTEEPTTEEPTTENIITEPPTEKSKESSVTSKNSNNNFQTYDNDEQQNTNEYVLNTSTKKVHRASCSAVKKIAPENYATISSLEDAYAQGYEGCKKCNP